MRECGESQDVLQRELVERFRRLQQGVEAQGQRHDVFVGDVEARDVGHASHLILGQVDP